MSKRSKLKSYLVTVQAIETKIGDRHPNIGKPITLTHTDYRTVKSAVPITPADCQSQLDIFEVRMKWRRENSDISPATVTVQEKKKTKAWKPRSTGRVFYSDSDYERRAVQYARWLFARDGKEFPDTNYRIDWGVIESAARKNKFGTPIYEKRIRAIQFGYYSSNMCGYSSFEMESEFVLPNWDFNPAAPIEEIGNWDAIDAHGVTHEKKIAARRKARAATADRKKSRGSQGLAVGEAA